MSQYLDLAGVQELWSKIKTLVGKKQDTLVSGTSIKTINSTSILGSGNIAVQPTLVSGTNIKTINSKSLLGSGNLAATDIIPTSTTPTSGSSSYITSGGVYSGISSLAKINNSSNGYIDIQRTYSTSYRLKIVRGTFSVARTSGTKSYSGTVSLPTSMPASTYQVFISRNGNNGYNNYEPYVKTKSTSSFTYYIEFLAANTDTVTYDYMAVYTA